MQIWHLDYFCAQFVIPVNSRSSGPNTLHAHNSYLTMAGSRKIRAREVVLTLARWSLLYVNYGDIYAMYVLSDDGFPEFLSGYF